METVQIVKRRPKASTLVLPEPTQLWTGSPIEVKRAIIEAKAEWAVFRSKFGFQIPANVNSLVFGSVPGTNQKLDKSVAHHRGMEVLYGLSLAQSNLSGINVCHWSSPECRNACVGKNGNNGFPRIMMAKIAKTRFLFEHPKEAGILLADFWGMAQRKAEEGYEVGGRPNVFADINWIISAPWIFERFNLVSFYDYTKEWTRESPFPNYHLTYSVDERTTDEQIIACLKQGKNVAVVFNDWRFLPTTYLGYPVHNGDADDVRWKDPKGVIVGLKRKGSLKRTSPMCRVA